MERSDERLERDDEEARTPQALSSLISSAKNYFQARIAAGESAVVLSRATRSRATVRESPEDCLARLGKMAARCERCPLHKTRTKVVFGTGSGKTPLVFVGEAPGRDEDLQGKPFVGRAGQLLTRIIQAANLKREDVYITNVVKCRPENNRDPLPEEIEMCSMYLKEQLELLKPKVICALGRFAAQALSGLKLSMADYRKADLFYGSTRVIATYHPAACLRNPELKRPVWEDIQRVMKVLKES